jgi:hypothetical protein
VILTECSHKELALVSRFCREHSPRTKLIVADSYGVFTRVINDFGASFEVLDKNGEEVPDVMIKGIEGDADEAIVELLPNNKHKLEDGDEVLITKVEGMKLKEGEKHDYKSDSINETIHKIKTLTPYSFKIGSTKKYEKYERNGFVKTLKTKKVMNFKTLQEVLFTSTIQDIPLDGNLAVADFEKM